MYCTSITHYMMGNMTVKLFQLLCFVLLNNRHYNCNITKSFLSMIWVTLTNGKYRTSNIWPRPIKCVQNSKWSSTVYVIHDTTRVWCAVWQYHWVWGGGVASNFFVYKMFDQLAPTAHEYTTRQNGMWHIGFI